MDENEATFELRALVDHLRTFDARMRRMKDPALRQRIENVIGAEALIVAGAHLATELDCEATFATIAAGYRRAA